MNVTNNRRLVVFGIVTVILPMIIGAVMYYIFCPEVWFVNRIDILLGISNRKLCTYQHNYILQFIRNYLFDFIWSYALTNTVFIIFNNNAKSLRIAFGVSVMLGILMELLQLLNVAMGIFDIWDIAVEGFGSLVGVFIIKNNIRRLMYEKV